MKEQEIVELVTNKIMLSLAGGSAETNKFDFKLTWYKLREDREKYEFLKDVCGLVNAYGGSDAFLVIGYHEKDKIFQDATLKDTGYNDDTDLMNIVKSNVDTYFNLQLIETNVFINGNDRKLSIIHIPPSLRKPHVIEKYYEIRNGKSVLFPNEIFIRNASGNDRATKGDLDIIYSERPTIKVEKMLRATINLNTIKVSKANTVTYLDSELTAHLMISPFLYLENEGLKPIHIYQIYFSILLEDDFELIALSPDTKNPVLESSSFLKFDFSFRSIDSFKLSEVEALVEKLFRHILKKSCSILIVIVEPNGNKTRIVPNLITI